MASRAAELLGKVESQVLKTDIPEFRVGDTIKVHTLIVEGQKERVQIFEGLVIKRSKTVNSANATFTVRKVSYHIGVERTFFLHSPRIEKIELVARGRIRRARLFYLRPLRGKAAAIKRDEVFNSGASNANTEAAESKSSNAAESASQENAQASA